MLIWFAEEVTTDMADVEVSGCESASAFVGDNVPGADLPVAPFSDPFADAAELGAPPALTELREYMDDTDIRFPSISVIEAFGRNAASGNWVCFESSAIAPAVNLGVSKSSTAISSRLVRLLGLEDGRPAMDLG